MSAADKDSIKTVALNASEFLDDVARLIIEQHHGELPRLNALTVLIAPRAAPALRAALSRAARARDVQTLMLPRVTTLRECVGEVDVGVAKITPESERVLDIFAILKKQRWFSASETLALSQELVRLADELTDQLIALPRSLDEHAHILARAYGVAKQNTHFSFEAELTYDVWRTLAEASAQTMDAATRYGLQLAKLANQAQGALYVVGQGGYAKREQAFFAAYARQSPVTIFVEPVPRHDCANAREKFVAMAFADAPGAPMQAAISATALAPQNLHCYRARDVEDEARAALNTIKQWLATGKRHIAVVALDRLAARRLRALAERDAILMADEIGWPYSTTLSATAVMRWLEAKRDGFYYQTLIDLLKSPFIFADLQETWGKPRVKTAVLVIERAIHHVGVIAGLNRVYEALKHFSSVSETMHEDAFVLLERLIEADRAFTNARKPAALWLQALQKSLSTLGLQQGLARDAAGAGLLDLLAGAEEDVVASRVNLSMSEWTDWLRTRMEEARFRDTAIDSPVAMTSLEATRFRTFDAALLIGASAGNLPGKPTTAGLFNQAVRRTLGLTTQAARSQDVTSDLLGLLSRSEACWISWQGQSAREPQLASPWVSALMLAARRSGVSLFARSETAVPQTAISTRRLSLSASNPAPMLAFGQVPRKISASGYQQLVDCPYQFFAQSVLKLREADEVAEEMEKRDFGEMVHAILNRFHQKLPRISDMPLTEAKGALIDVTATVFAESLEQNFIARAWQLQWESAIDGYLAWQLKREADGWQWQAGELKSSFDLPLDNGETLCVEGRIDRLDVKNLHAGVIDYKARHVQALQKKLVQPGEDVQLAVYAALAEVNLPVADAAYLAIMRDEVKAVNYPEPETAGSENIARLQFMFESLYAGARLPAQGVDSVCERCAVRGVCRKDYWTPPTSERTDD